MAQSPLLGEKISILLLCLILVGCGRSGPTVAGEWTARDGQGKEVRLIFGPGTRFRALSGEGVKTDGTFWEDFRENPAHLDLKMANGDVVQTIVRFKSGNLEIQSVKPGAPRPTTFNSETIIWTKAASPVFLTATPASRPAPGPPRRRP